MVDVVGLKGVFVLFVNPYKGLGGNKKLPSRRIPIGGIVQKVLLTPTQLSHKHHHGGAICPSYVMVPLDTPDRTRATSSERVGQEHFGLV